MKTLLELFRIVLLFALICVIGSYILDQVYRVIGGNTEKYEWMSSIAILILFFVLYRNKLQFSGWYKGERKKLPTRVSQILISLAVVLLILPPILSKII